MFLTLSSRNPWNFLRDECGRGTFCFVLEVTLGMPPGCLGVVASAVKPVMGRLELLVPPLASQESRGIEE